MHDRLSLESTCHAGLDILPIGFLRCFRLPGDASGHIVSRNQLMLCIGEIAAVAAFTAPIGVEVQRISRIGPEALSLMQHRGECLIDILKAIRDIRIALLDQVPAIRRMQVQLFQRTAQRRVVLNPAGRLRHAVSEGQEPCRMLIKIHILPANVALLFQTDPV